MNDKKAKKEKITTTIVNVSFASIILLLLILPAIFAYPEKNVGIKGSYFMYGTPPFIVKLVCGVPDETKKHDDFAEETLTYYNKKIFSYDATVTYKFKVHQLAEVRAELDVPKEQAETIYNNIREKMRETYSKSDNFFENEDGRFGRNNVGDYMDYEFGVDLVSVTFSDDKVNIYASSLF